MLRAVAAAVLLMAACGKKPATGGFSDVVLPTADGKANVSLASCPTERCLAVYVAPWCGYCRASTPLLKQLRPFLRRQGVDSWVIVGMDQEGELKAYAREFGADTLLDVRKAIDARNVPHFYMVDKTGKILKHVAGLPPNPTDLVSWILEK